MNRLQSELNRLFLPPLNQSGTDDSPLFELIDSDGRVRAMVMELTRPPRWDVLARVWSGVQSELDLPAPAIAVSGTDGLQLWFSLAQAVSAHRAHAFLEGLRSKYLADIDTSRIRLMPSTDASLPRAQRHAWPVPARQGDTDNWSAFVASDLASIFEDAAWLDIPPSEEGQAQLLQGIAPMKPADFDAAMRRFEPMVDQSQTAAATAVIKSATTGAPETDPRRFLLRVMADDSVALALRIEAAKALIQHSPDGGTPHRG